MAISLIPVVLFFGFVCFVFGYLFGKGSSHG